MPQIWLRIIVIIVGVGALYFPGPHAGLTTSAGNQTSASQDAEPRNLKVVPYGDRTPQCLHPKLSHLCSDISSTATDSVHNCNRFAITCDDSCGNVFSFTAHFDYWKRKEWEFASLNYGDITDVTILKNASLLSHDEENRAELEKQMQDVKDQLQKISQQALAIWMQTIEQYPVSLIENFSQSYPLDETPLPYTIEMLAGPPNEVTGYLQLIALQTGTLRKLSLQAAATGTDPNPLWPLQENTLKLTSDFITDNERNLHVSDSPSLIALSESELAFVAQRINQSEGIIPSPAANFILALANNSSLHDLFGQQEKLTTQQLEVYDKQKDEDERLDPNARDASQKERCLGYEMVPYERYPTNSAELEKETGKILEKISAQLPSLDKVAKDYLEEYFESLPAAQAAMNRANAEKSPFNYKNVVPLQQNQMNIAEINKWSAPLFTAATGSAGKKSQAEALQLLHDDCQSLALIITPPATIAMARAREVETKASVEGAFRYIQIHQHVGQSEILFDTHRTSDTNVEGVLLVFDHVASKPIGLTEICLALGGYCPDPRNQIKTEPRPAIDVEMPHAKGYPRQLLMPVIRVDKKTFYEKIRESGAN